MKIGGVLAGQSTLVTGATGFIGGRLAERLTHEEHADVRGMVRHWNKATWISRFPVQLHAGDVLDAASVDQAIAGCSIVFHCASGGNSDREYLDTNVNGTRNILEACCRHLVKRLVYVSSVAVHGPMPPDGANEHDAYRPQKRGYSDSKIEAEKLVFSYAKDYGLEVVIIRPTFVWGPRSNLFTVRPLQQMRTGQFRLVDDGQGDCHAVFVEHLVDAMIAAATRPAAVGRAFLVTDGYGISWGEFFVRYAQWLGIPQLRSLSSRSSSSQLRCYVFERLQSKLQAWQRSPAPLWRRVARRLAKSTCDTIQPLGVMSTWDLAKYARRGRLDTSSTREILGAPRYSFDAAMQITEQWVREQLGFGLGLPQGARSDQVSP